MSQRTRLPSNSFKIVLDDRKRKIEFWLLVEVDLYDDSAIETMTIEEIDGR